MRIEDTGTAWTRDYQPGQEITVVLKSGEGAYVADEATLAGLAEQGQVVARYCRRQPERLGARHRRGPERGRATWSA